MLKKVFISIAVVLTITIIIGLLFIQNNKPKYEGELKLSSISEEVQVYFDDVGVPHIYAQNEKDAYTTLGYLHAQDRLWQMELIRRISAGRLAEIFGESMVNTDKFFKGIGIERAAKKTIAELDTTLQSYQLTQAYLNGINQYIKEGNTPVEYRLASVKKEEFTILDAYNVFGYMAFSFAHAHKTDPFLSQIKDQLGVEYLHDLAVASKQGTTTIKTKMPKKKLAHAYKISAQIHQIIENSPVPAFIGSNSWVVGAKKTKHGKVILANDPHISFAQPSVWYQAHIITPQYEMYGFHLALSAFPLLGHNRDYAYGMTMFENDDVDFYSNQSQNEYTVLEETIKVKGEEDVVFQIKVGQHGPVMNNFIDAISNEEPLEMEWVYTKYPNHMLDVSYQLSHATSLKTFKKGVEKIHAPGLNVMYGDAKNNIAWFAAAKLLNYENDYDSKLIINKTESPTPLGFEHNPQAINPRWQYVYSANNQPEKIDGKFYPGYYLPEDRAKRIVDLLKDKDSITAKEMQNMITDVTSSVIPQLTKIIVDKVSKLKLTKNEELALNILKEWDGSYTKKAIAPVIYNKFIYRLFFNTFADEMGDDLFHQFLKTHVYKRQIAKQIKSYKSIWWDDISTKTIKENRDEIFTKSLDEAVAELETQLGDDIDDWTWDRVTTVTHKHAFDKVALLRHIFNVGPFTTNGGNEVLNNHIFQINGNGHYQVTAGPSTRRIIDFSDVENSVGILPTGQSGNVFSKFYKDQASDYLEGKFVKLKINKDEIITSSTQLNIIPKE